MSAQYITTTPDRDQIARAKSIGRDLMPAIGMGVGSNSSLTQSGKLFFDSCLGGRLKKLADHVHRKSGSRSKFQRFQLYRLV